MITDLIFSKLLLVALLWLCFLLHVLWPYERAPAGPTTPKPTPPLVNAPKSPNLLRVSSINRSVRRVSRPPIFVPRRRVPRHL